LLLEPSKDDGGLGLATNLYGAALAKEDAHLFHERVER
jgi:hypothetical protein